MEYKGYLIKADKQSPTLFRVATAGQGGKIPLVLDSLFTSSGLAKAEIDSYLATKESKNGKTRTESGD